MSMIMPEWIEGRPPEVLPGMLVELDDGERYLVGDINPQGGQCNCCSAGNSCSFEDSIKRYAVVIEP